MDFVALVWSRLDRFNLIVAERFTAAPMTAQLMRRLVDGTSRDITAGVILNDRIGVCRNDWGHKYGQTSFLLFERSGRGWSKEHLGNYEVEWRGPRREPKSEAAIDASMLAALDDALRAAVKELL